MIETVGDLKKVLEGFSDNTPLEAHQEAVGWFYIEHVSKLTFTDLEGSVDVATLRIKEREKQGG